MNNTENDKIKKYERLAVKNPKYYVSIGDLYTDDADSKTRRFTIRKPSITAFWHILFSATLGATALNIKRRSTFMRKAQTKAKQNVLPASVFAMKTDT